MSILYFLLQGFILFIIIAVAVKIAVKEALREVKDEIIKEFSLKKTGVVDSGERK